ncbi:Riboflavin biosynthesis protein PYRR, chloroplastic, partial [Cucurbita argyrosperma subsp. sororia]
MGASWLLRPALYCWTGLPLRPGTKYRRRFRPWKPPASNCRGATGVPLIWSPMNAPATTLRVSAFVQELESLLLVNAPLICKAASQLPFSVLKYAMTLDGNDPATHRDAKTMDRRRYKPDTGSRNYEEEAMLLL